MTYAPKPIDFTDHVATYECNHRGHGLCGDCPDEPNRRHPDHVRLDITVSDDVAEKLDAMTEQGQVALVDTVCAGCGTTPCDGDIHARGNGWDDEEDDYVPRTPCTEDEILSAMSVAERSLALGGADVNECDVNLLSRALIERDAQRFMLARQAECDLISMMDHKASADEMRLALEGLLDAFPRLSKDYSEARQQEALRAARKAVGR